MISREKSAASATVSDGEKMSYPSTIGSKQALKEHVLAVSRDFISQPRLSKYWTYARIIVFIIYPVNLLK